MDNKDGSGQISFHEFSVWWTERQLVTQGHINADVMAEMRRVWQDCDTSGDSLLNPLEFEEVLSRVSESEWLRAVDPSSGRPYFYNNKTKATCWEEPDTASRVKAFLEGQGIGHGQNDDAVAL